MPTLPRFIRRLVDQRPAPVLIQVPRQLTTEVNCDECSGVATLTTVNYEYRTEPFEQDFNLPAWRCESCEAVSYPDDALELMNDSIQESLSELGLRPRSQTATETMHGVSTNGVTHHQRRAS